MTLVLREVRLPLAPFTLEVDAELSARVTALFGPSGSGKTSLLDLVAGLRRAPSAHVAMGDRVLTDTRSGLFVPPRERRIGYVPQDGALFPHLSVRANLLYGAKRRAAPSDLFTLERVSEVLETGPFLDRGVGRLSGGERQRVALARALLSAPELLLLDEPLAALDSALKGRIVEYLKRVRDEFAVPMLYVTHDRDEVAALAEEVVVLERGRVMGRGAPAALSTAARAPVP